jgi:uncharacterized lipoprotein YddW (UPF0748 family)
MNAILFAMTLLPTTIGQADAPQPMPREFRGVWVATVGNIDWPSKKGLSTKQQQAELIAILDKAAELKLNAVIFQIRPMCDALYASKLEPWSEYLTGKLGQAPDPFYDPLDFAIREAHARGLELHAWFNPYRAHHPSATSPIPDNHLVKRRPDLAKVYGKHHWLNPTHADVQKHSLAVMLDVVRRYDLDGIHYDDYFYPYKEKDDKGKLIPFPDEDTWQAYLKSGGKLARDDWRRDAVNHFVRDLFSEVKALKPWVKVGISPFGIWKPGHPPGIAGLDQYSELYADAKLWLNEGWCDYFTPQLYWPIAQEKQSYPKLLAWWANENTKGRQLWPGNYTSRVTGKDKGWPASEVVDQIKATRKQPGAAGNVHFSMKPLLQNTGGIADALRDIYTESALPPAIPWDNSRAPAPPRVQRAEKNGQATFTLQPGDKSPIRWYLARTRANTGWLTRLIAGDADFNATLTIPRTRAETHVTAINRFGQESKPAVLK